MDMFFSQFYTTFGEEEEKNGEENGEREDNNPSIDTHLSSDTVINRPRRVSRQRKEKPAVFFICDPGHKRQMENVDAPIDR